MSRSSTSSTSGTALTIRKPLLVISNKPEGACILLRNQKLEDDDIIALCDEMREQKTRLKAVESIWLSDNNFGDIGALHLSLVINQTMAFINLERLFLHFNHIDTDGLLHLTGAFSSMPKLRLLYLGRNKISDAFLSALAAAMPKLKYLEDLSVGGVTSYPLNTGVVAIADVLRSMRKLQVISFLGTSALPEAIGKLADAIEYSKSIRAVDISAYQEDNTHRIRRFKWLLSSDGYLYRRGQAWSPIRHHLYSPEEKLSIKTAMILYLVDSERRPLFPDAWIWILPIEVLFVIFQFVVVTSDFSWRMSA